MKVYRCPWCGEKGIKALPLPGRSTNLFTGRSDYSIGCKNCGQRYYDMSGGDSNVSFVFLLLLVGFVSAHLIIGLFLWYKSILLNRYCGFSCIICLCGLNFFNFYKPIYQRFDENDKKIMNFEYSFKSKIEFLPLKSGGIFWPKKQFYNETILACRFDYKEKTVNPYIQNSTVSLVFDDIKYTDSGATCKVGFILHEKIDQSFLKPGVEFTVSDNKDRVFAKGKVTEIIQNATQPVKIDITKKRKSWQDPDYFN